MAETNEAPEHSSLLLEYMDSGATAIAARSGLAGDLAARCVEILANIALDAARARLVITGEFVTSVKDRLPASDYRDTYDVRRNEGFVGGKTMAMPDGTTDVLLQSHFFEPTDVEGEQAERVVRALRTVAHEAHHVAMRQAGEADASAYDDRSWVRRNLLHVADQVVDEYRAEAGIDQELRNVLGYWDPTAVLGALRDDLRRIALVEYQAHLDVEKLSYDVGQEAQTAWKLLGYVAAALHQPDGSFEGLPAEVTDDIVWQLMGAPHWDAFLAVLGKVPPANERVNRSTIEGSIEDLADVFGPWLRTFGFEWTDVGADSRFMIVGWDLLVPESLS